MEVTYLALSGDPSFCVQLYGITVLPDKRSGRELYLVFELATHGPVWNYLRAAIYEQPQFSWLELLELFGDVAFGLWKGLHEKGIAHGWFRLLVCLIVEIYMRITSLSPSESTRLKSTLQQPSQS